MARNWTHALEGYLLPGEAVLITADACVVHAYYGEEWSISGHVHVTPAQLLFTRDESNSILHAVPIHTISRVKKGSTKSNRGVRRLSIVCKDVRLLTFCFDAVGGGCKRVLTLLNHIAFPEQIPAMFAFQWEPAAEDVVPWAYDAMAEYARLGLCEHPFRVSHANADYSVCDSYPPELCIPIVTSDEVLCAVAKFRSRGRLPVANYRYAPTKTPMYRSSQPLVGLRRNRSEHDVDYLRIMAGTGPSPEERRALPPCSYGSGMSGASPASLNSQDAPSPSSVAPLPLEHVASPAASRRGTRNTPRSALARRRAARSASRLRAVKARTDVVSPRGRRTRAGTSARSGGPVAHPASSRTIDALDLDLDAGEDGEGADELLYIVDARPKANAVGQTIMGAGYEPTGDRKRYKGCHLEFLDIGNIHVMRESLAKLTELCADKDVARPDSNADGPTFWARVQSCSWFAHMSRVLAGSMRVVQLLLSGIPVLVHCSDGWDRTAQLTCLAQLMLDPYFRTMEGFAVLVEKEWLAFGHKFAQRCGHGSFARKAKDSQRSPIFIQFIDAVWQLTQQFPTSFEFNQEWLIAVADACYSGVFGTFLGNTHRQRHAECRVTERTTSLWAFLLAPKRRHLFENAIWEPPVPPSAGQGPAPLEPRVAPHLLQLWRAMYFRFVWEPPGKVADPTAPGFSIATVNALRHALSDDTSVATLTKRPIEEGIIGTADDEDDEDEDDYYEAADDVDDDDEDEAEAYEGDDATPTPTDAAYRPSIRVCGDPRAPSPADVDARRNRRLASRISKRTVAHILSDRKGGDGGDAKPE